MQERAKSPFWNQAMPALRAAAMTWNGFNRFKQRMRSLGLVCLNHLGLTNELYHNCRSGAGMKCLIPKVINTVLLQLVTRTYDPKIKRYVFGFFNILVYLGVGVVVWHKFMPGDLSHAPDGFLNHSIQPFLEPTSVVEGYKRVSYLFTKDIIQTVITSYKHEHPFNDVLSVDQFNMNDGIVKGRVACIGTGIMMAIFLATKVLVPLST